MRRSIKIEDGVADNDLTMPDAFRLQCDEVERDRCPSHKVAVHWENLAYKLVNILKDAKQKHKTEYKDISLWSKLGVKYPLCDSIAAIANTTSSITEYKWIAPSEVTVINESSFKLLNKENFTVDIFVIVPSELFGKRDYVNLVYPAKRSHYMCSCLLAIKTVMPDMIVKFVPGQGGDTVLQNLSVSERTNSSQGRILLHFYAVESALAKSSRFTPSMSNLRPSTIYPNITDKDNLPTPLFNQRLLQNMHECSVVQQIDSELQNKPNILQVLGLCAKWFRCRNLIEFNDIFLSAFMIYLLKKEIVAEKQDLLTILRNFFSTLVNCDFSLVMGLYSSDFEETAQSLYKSTSPVVFLDYSGYWNIADGISLESLNRVKMDLRQCLPLLGNCTSFDAMFIEPQNLYTTFDHYYRVNFTSELLSSLTPSLSLDTINETDRLNALLRRFKQVIYDGMGERFDVLCIHPLDTSSNEFNGTYSSVKNFAFLLAFRINKGWTNPITVGPVATEPTAKSFCDFWKGKTQLRKFADTRICECMVWSNEPSSEVPLIILRFLITNHFSFPSNCISWRSALPTSLYYDKATGTKITTAFASLSSILRTLKGLPLMITNIHGVSPFIRGTEPCPSSAISSTCSSVIGGHQLPTLHKVPSYTSCVTVHIKLEYSGKWGSDLEGIRRMSGAFYVQIAEKLKHHGIVSVPTMDQLFVVIDNVVFKLLLVHQKIFKMLEARVEELRTNCASPTTITLENKRLMEYKKRYITESLLQASLLSFSTKYPVFGEAVQILKRWLSAKLLSNAIPDLAVELIMAAAFEQPTIPPPQAPIVAFHRCLSLLVNHNWSARPLIVDFNAEWKDDDLMNYQRSFVKMRPVLPPMVIITNEDPLGIRWTHESPSPLLLKRIISLASQTMSILNENIEKSLPTNLEFTILYEDISAYDAVIEIFPKTNVRKRKMDECKVEKTSTLPVVDFDPVGELISNLSSHFHSVALFFYNKYGGDKIGIKWKPQELEVPAKISRCCLHKKSESSGLLLNKEEVIEGIKLIGKGIVKNIVH